MSTTPTRTRPRTATQAITLLIGLPVVIGLMLFSFLAPSLASGPKDVPLAVAAPEPVLTQLEGRLAQAGDNAPDLQVVTDEAAVTDLIHNRKAVGGLAVDPSGATVYTATGNGAPYLTLLNGIAEQMRSGGQDVTVTDLAPTSPDDPTTMGITTLGLPLAFGGLVSAVTATLLFRGRRWIKMGVIAGIALLSAAVVAWMMHGIYGTLTGNPWQEFLAIALGIAAISLTAAGLAGLIGLPGLGIAAVTVVFIANPLSGLATGPWWLPAGWSILGQWLPIGATGHLIRSLSFFDGAGAGSSWWILTGWVVLGALLLTVDRSRVKSETVSA